MGRVSRGFLCVVAALGAGCASNDRVASIDARLAEVEASLAFQARLSRLEQAVLKGGSGASSEALGQMKEELRLITADLERLKAKSENKTISYAPDPGKTAVKEVPLGQKKAWVSPEGESWNDWNRVLGHELFAFYTEGKDSPLFKENEKDAKGENTGRTWQPRDPGLQGLNDQDSEKVVGRSLTEKESRFIASTGKTVDLSKFVGRKRVVLVILRGYDPQYGVCISCSEQTLALADNLQKFLDRDAELFLVYPGAAENVGKFIDAVRDLRATPGEMPLRVLLDVDLSIVKDFRIEGKLAKPTSMIIDKKGIVRFCHVGQNKTDRPTVPNLLKVLDGLGDDGK